MSALDTCKVRKRPCLNDAICFLDGDLEEIFHPHEVPLVINANIKPKHWITKIMVDPRGLVNVLYHEAFERWATKLKI